MMFDSKSFGKMSIVLQVMLGFVLLAYGIIMAVNAQVYSDGDSRFLMLFLATGVLFVVAGLPSFVEGIMIMYRGDTTGKKDDKTVEF